MKNDVRIARKEAKRQRTAREQATYGVHKAASRKRRVTIREWDQFFKEHGIPGSEELIGVMNKLITEFRAGGIEASDYANRIFDPRLTSLATLPVGVLDHKELPLPSELIPDTRDDLRALCERMIIRNRNAELIDLVVSGWPGQDEPKDKLTRHVNDLWSLKSVAPLLYRALICGHHNVVAEYLWREVPPKQFTRLQLRRMLVCHALLWRTNDVQLILARNVLAERNPFRAFIVSGKRKLEPVRIVSELRDPYLLLRLLLDLYVTTAAEEGGTQLSEFPDDPIAQLLKRRIESHAEAQKIDLIALRTRLDATIPYLKKVLSRPGTKLRKELEKPVGSSELPKHFHGLWFSGLSNVQASALPLLRYLQAETELEQLIDELVPVKGQKIEPRLGTALPAFSEARLPDGWRTRAQDLLYGYRSELLEDADRRGEKRSKNAGWAAIKKTIDFLDTVGERLIEDCVGDGASVRRTYYLLDIVPECRLHRGFSTYQERPRAGRPIISRETGAE